MLGISPKPAGISPARAGVAPKAVPNIVPERPMPNTLAQFQDIVCDEVQIRRGMGLKAAFVEVARAFGLTERRVRAAWHHEIRTVTADEWEAVKRGRIETLRKRQEQLAHQIATLGLLDDRSARL